MVDVIVAVWVVSAHAHGLAQKIEHSFCDENCDAKLFKEGQLNVHCPAAVSVVERVIVVDLVLAEQQKKSLNTCAQLHTHSLSMTRAENAFQLQC